MQQNGASTRSKEPMSVLAIAVSLHRAFPTPTEMCAQFARHVAAARRQERELSALQAEVLRLRRELDDAQTQLAAFARWRMDVEEARRQHLDFLHLVSEVQRTPTSNLSPGL